ncbi:EfeM/EfeO family lipoprotein [Psychromicrobium xiongbiense]|uniref:EfeM/EfeO family lipoprotein n=1 Tax=Psychromicrobium xiongbiense TaxID=3051184 RepID=UPI0025575013|nr:EfeM/EfeO family lipoprotein [Psychromicrobium sp. YIM S02556]
MPLSDTPPTPVLAPASTMDAALDSYRGYVESTLHTLQSQLNTLAAAIQAQNVDAARDQWLAAQLSWQRVGAAYGSFGDLGGAINGLPLGLEKGVADPGFTGLHRVEYGLYHGQSAAELAPVIEDLQKNLADLLVKLPELTVAGSAMPLRCHEILEDSLRDNLSGNNDQGSGMALALTWADVEATQVVLTLLSSLIDAHKAGYSALISADLDALDAALSSAKLGDRWPDYRQLPLAQRQPVNGAIGRALETLAYVPPMFSLDD